MQDEDPLQEMQETHFGRTLARLFPRITITVHADQMDFEECRARIEDIFHADLEQLGKTWTYYEMKKRHEQLISRGLTSPYLMQLGDLDYPKRVLTAQIERVYADLSPQAMVFWLTGIQWAYRGRTLDADLSTAGTLRFMHTHPLVALTPGVWEQPEVTHWFFHDELTNPAAEEGVEECRGWLPPQKSQQLRAEELKRFFGRSYRPLLNAWMQDAWG